jgi:outer membrane immunogenic protein
MAFLDKAAVAAILAATSIAGGAAYAADLSEAPVEQQQIYSPTSAISWTGFYAGINGGFGSGSAPSSTPYDIGLSGGFLGAQIGYNHHLTDNIVLGIEADAQWANMTGTITLGQTVTETINWFGTVRGRLGYAMDTWLPYVTGGLAVAGATRTTTAGGGQSIGATHTGYVLGAGIEWAFAGDWSAKLEYQHLSLGSVTYVINSAPDPSVSLSADTIRIGLNKHF